MTEIDKAYRMDPAAVVINNVYSMIATIQGEDALAIRHMNKSLELGLTQGWGHALRALIRSGDWEEIERLAYTVIEEQSFARLCIEAHRDPSLYPEVLEKAAQERAQNGSASDFYVYCTALAGDLDEAFAGLDAVMADDPTNIKKMWSPDSPYVAMRKTPRFRQVLRDYGFLELYEVRGWPDRCRPAGADDFVCD
jgi:hypothetical protein